MDAANERILKRNVKEKLILFVDLDHTLYEGQLKPVSDAKDFLETLSKCGIEIYIVTEGDTSTQIDKVKKLWLTDFVSPDKVIVGENKSPEFYSTIIRTVSEGSPIKLAMVGDRYDKDVAPLIELFGNGVITIRLLYGKYKNEYSVEELEKKRLPKPTRTVNTLAEAKNLLIRKSMWDVANVIEVKN